MRYNNETSACHDCTHPHCGLLLGATCKLGLVVSTGLLEKNKFTKIFKTFFTLFPFLSLADSSFCIGQKLSMPGPVMKMRKL